MKLSKNLLKAMVLGISMGAAASSCTMFEDAKEIEKKVESVITCGENGQTNNQNRNTNGENCPACGMG